MKIILLADVEDVGKIGDTIAVADGFARNFLIPRSLAVAATERSLKQLTHQKRLAENRRRKAVSAAESVKRKIETLQLTISAKVGEEDKLYGSVTSRDIHDALTAQEVDVDKRRIVLDEPIKRTGVFDVPVKLGYEITAIAKVWVVKE